MAQQMAKLPSNHEFIVTIFSFVYVTTHLILLFSESMCKWDLSSIPSLEGDDIIFMLTDLHLPGEVDWITDWVMMQNCFGHKFL